MSAKLKLFAAGFSTSAFLIFLLALCSGESLKDSVCAASGTGLIAGVLTTLFGRRMLNILEAIFEGGA